MTNYYTIKPPVNPWARISEIAARLGVPPAEALNDGARILTRGADGQDYDLFAVIAAALDKIDAVLTLKQQIDEMQAEIRALKKLAEDQK